MTTKRKVEVFSASCPICEKAIDQVKEIACSSCEVVVRDMQDSANAKRAKSFGIRSIPAFVIDGKLAECCDNGIDEHVLKEAGLGKPSNTGFLDKN